MGRPQLKPIVRYMHHDPLDALFRGLNCRSQRRRRSYRARFNRPEAMHSPECQVLSLSQLLSPMVR
jgi:hypothetical protein